MTYITRIANKRISPNIFFLAYKSTVSIGNLVLVGGFSPAMPHIINEIHSLNIPMRTDRFI